MADKICCVCEKLANPKCHIEGKVGAGDKIVKMVAYFCEDDMRGITAHVQAGSADIKGMKYEHLECFDMEGHRIDTAELKALVEENKEGI